MAYSPLASSRERRQQDLRDLTRLRVSLVQERARLESRVHKVLDAAGVNCQQWKVDILGFSGKRILQALCAGESDPMRLAKLMHPAVKATEAQVVAALTADMREHHRFVLRERAFPD
jgi:transposase